MRLLAWLLTWTPLWLASGLCNGLSWIWWLVLPVRKSVAVDNLIHALPECPPGPTLRAAFASLALGFVELLQVRRGRVTLAFHGDPDLLERGVAGQANLFIGCHSAGFEAATHLFAQRVPTAAFVRPPRQESARVLMEQLRGALQTLAPHGSMAQGYAVLSQGKTLMFALDQRRAEGIPVAFFGRPAWTSPAVAVAAIRTGLPVYGGWISRSAPGVLHAHVERIELEGDIERDTQRMSDWMEANVRREPETWLWLHDRWRKP
ncbi:MAG: KDO2-lipid IV(A) lauroyltransferase [Cognaticolwellia sp.]